MHSKTNAGIMHRYSESIDTFGNSSEIDSDSNSDIEDDHETTRQLHSSITKDNAILATRVSPLAPVTKNVKVAYLPPFSP